jgi:acyl carrier protein
MAKEVLNEEKIDFPSCTALGGLSHYISNPAIDNFQPMNVTFGIIDSPEKRFRKKREKNAFISQNSLEKLQEIMVSINDAEKEKIESTTEESRLVEDVGLNSVGMLYLVIVLEESFQIKFEDVGTATFCTIGNVIDYIEAKMQ